MRQTLGRYQVTGTLGAGGMGQVFRARDPSVNRDVAIKLLSAGGSSDRSRRERFRREAEILAGVNHRHVVRVHEVGDTRDGIPFLVMELVEGGSLMDRLDRGGPLAPREASALVSKVASALATLHAAGLIHRDVKPDNVLIDAQGEPLLSDFGMAKDLDATRCTLSQTGHFMGTPGFWAPEQARGDFAGLGTHTDIYGLGATLFACLTGEPPIPGRTLPEIVAATRAGKVAPPSKLVRAVPSELDAICLRCLERDPTRRYSSAVDLADDLDRFLSGAEVATGRRPPKLVFALVALASALTVWGVASSVTGSRPSPSATPPPSPTTSTSRAPSPSPTPEPTLTDLRYALPVGTEFRWTLRHERDSQADVPDDAPFIYRDFTDEGRRITTYSMRQRVIDVSQARVTSVFEIDHLRVEIWSPDEAKVEYDTRRPKPEHPLSAYSGVIGKPLEVQMELATGQALRVSGTEAADKAVQSLLKAEVPLLEGFGGNGRTAGLLNRVFHFLPGKDHSRPGPWHVKEAVNVSAFEVKEAEKVLSLGGAKIEYDPDRLGVTFRCEVNDGPSGARIEWRGTDSLRKIRGWALLREGRVRQAEVVERITINVTTPSGPLQVRTTETTQLSEQ